MRRHGSRLLPGGKAAASTARRSADLRGHQGTRRLLERNREASCGDRPQGTCEGAVIKSRTTESPPSLERSTARRTARSAIDGRADGGADCVPQRPCGTGVTTGVRRDSHLSFCDSQYTFDLASTCPGAERVRRLFRHRLRRRRTGPRPTLRWQDARELSGGVIAREECDTLAWNAGRRDRRRVPVPGAGGAPHLPHRLGCAAGVCAGDPATTADWTLMVLRDRQQQPLASRLGRPTRWRQSARQRRSASSPK